LTRKSVRIGPKIRKTDDEEGQVKRVLIAACICFICVSSAGAACKYKAADGSWTYSQSCARMSEKEIDESANMVIKKNQEYRKPETGVEGRRLRGFDYSNTTHSGMRIRMVEPNKGPPKQELESQ
jgi:hypothetical protein